MIFKYFVCTALFITKYFFYVYLVNFFMFSNLDILQKIEEKKRIKMISLKEKYTPQLNRFYSCRITVRNLLVQEERNIKFPLRPVNQRFLMCILLHSFHSYNIFMLTTVFMYKKRTVNKNHAL